MQTEAGRMGRRTNSKEKILSQTCHKKHNLLCGMLDWIKKKPEAICFRLRKKLFTKDIVNLHVTVPVSERLH